MFQSLERIDFGGDDDLSVYRLVDSDFVVELRVSESLWDWMDALIVEYGNRNLPVAPNLARLLMWFYPKYRYRYSGMVMLMNDSWRKSFDYLHPRHHYTAKYHDCVMRHLTQLTFGKRMD